MRVRAVVHLAGRRAHTGISRPRVSRVVRRRRRHTLGTRQPSQWTRPSALFLTEKSKSMGSIAVGDRRTRRYRPVLRHDPDIRALMCYIDPYERALARPYA